MKARSGVALALLAALVAVSVGSHCVLASGGAKAKALTFFVSTAGDDKWSGTRASGARSGQGPFATVHRAVLAARSARGGDVSIPVTIRISAGVYSLSEAIELTPEDSNISFQGEGRGPVVLSGGRAVTGWQEVKRGDRIVWCADLPETRTGRWTGASLWVNGERATRARYPNRGYLHIAELPDTTKEWTDGQTRFRYKEGDLPAQASLEGAEVVAMTRWVESRLPVVSVVPATRTINFSKRSVFQLGAEDPYYVEGAMDLLDAPGEWCLDAKSAKLFYVPRPGEKLKSISAVVPVLSQILLLKGEPDRGSYVEKVGFDRITFCHAEWLLGAGGAEKVTVWPPPNPQVGGFAQAAIGVPAAVQGAGVRGSTFTACKFTHLSSYGLELGRACSSNLVENCEFADLGAGGIRLGETAIRDNPREHARANTVRNCTLHHGGRTFQSGIGLWIGQSSDNVVTHNLIHDFYYTGISIGWTWGYGPTLASNNLVAFNHVHHIGEQSDGDGPILSDMGGIYTLGMQPGTRIVNNLWHDIQGLRYGGWGIYLDEGSSSILVESNLVYRTTHGGFHQHYGATNRIQNNIFAFARDHQVQRSRPEPHISFAFTTNIVFFDQGVLLGGTWDNDHYVLDWNVYFDARAPAKAAEMKFPGGTLETWRKRGHDQHSVVADPLFRDPVKGNFRLRTDSPALKQGFKPIDVSKVGPQSKP